LEAFTRKIIALILGRVKYFFAQFRNFKIVVGDVTVTFKVTVTWWKHKMEPEMNPFWADEQQNYFLADFPAITQIIFKDGLRSRIKGSTTYSFAAHCSSRRTPRQCEQETTAWKISL